MLQRFLITTLVLFKRSVSPLLLVIAISCIDPYAPPLKDNEVSALIVVDGFVNTSAKVAHVRLSNALSLSSSDKYDVVSGAEVWIEDQEQHITPLPEITKGNYQLTGITFDKESRYTLNIRRSNGKTYHSDVVEFMSTPPVDSISWHVDKTTVVLDVSTHDPSNKSNYFKWDFDETYEYNSKIQTFWLAVNGSYKKLTEEELIHVCYKTAPSKSIRVASVESLSDKVIRHFPLQRVGGGDQKISRRYSINVRQQTLTKEGHAYWSNLAKTTESLGGLFDPLPAAVLGNMHSSDPQEIVLGFFGGGDVTEKRIFIDFYDLPDQVNELLDDSKCPGEGLVVLLGDLSKLNKAYYLTEPLYDPHGDIIAFGAAPAYCVDCTFGGGSTMKPPFWKVAPARE